MKNLYTLLIIILFCNIGVTQENTCSHEGHYKVACDHAHTNGESCVHYLTTEELAELKAESSRMERDNTMVRSFPVPRPYRILIPYDNKLLIENGGTYTNSEIVSMITANVHRFVNGLNNSQIENEGVYLRIIPWEAPTYGSIHDYRNVLADQDDGIMDELYVMKNERLDMDALIFITIQSVDGKGINTFISESVAEVFTPFWTRNIGVVNFKEIELKSITLAHELGHGLSADHEEGKNGSVSKPYARAYLENNGDGTFHSIVKSGNLLFGELEAFSGPDSYAPKKVSGEVVHVYLDSTTNNALAVSTLLGYYWMHNLPLSADILGDTQCGIGTLSAISDNATEFTWEVVSGEVTIETTSDSTISYTSYMESTIMMTATAEGKDYSDTIYVEVPAMEITNIDTTMSIGSTLPDGQVINEAGSYDLLVESSNPEDCAYIKRYEVSITTNTIETEVLTVSLSPNPVRDILCIETEVNFRHISICNAIGKRVWSGDFNQDIDVSRFRTGTYILFADTKYIGQFVKL